MATTIRINGVDIERLKWSLQIETAIEQRSTASFTVVDRLGTASYVRGQAVEIFSDLPIPPFIHPQFNGYIDSVRKNRIAPNSPTVYHTISCMDYCYLADKRRAAEAYAVPHTAGWIVDDLFDKYLAPEGVTIGAIQAGPTIEQMVINYQPVSLALDALATRANFIWYIDEFKQLFFVVRTTALAPFAVSDVDIVRENNMTSELTESNPMYRNRQYIRGGRDVTSIQTENRTGDGKIEAFPMAYPLNQVPTVTVGGAGQSVGIKGVDTAKQCYWSKGDPIITFETAPGVGVALVFVYIGEYDIMIQVDNAVEQAARKLVEGGTGIVEGMEDAPALNSKQAAFDSATALLDKYGVVGKQFTFPIRVWGLKPGQMVTVSYTEYGLVAADLLVESISVSEFGPEELRYSIKTIEGPELGDWTGFFKALANMKEEVLGRLNIGSDQVLIILASVSENWEWNEAITETVYACPICDAGLLCGPGVIVC